MPPISVRCEWLIVLGSTCEIWKQMETTNSCNEMWQQACKPKTQPPSILGIVSSPIWHRHGQ
jgi:hypothetical protein